MTPDRPEEEDDTDVDPERDLSITADVANPEEVLGAIDDVAYPTELIGPSHVMRLGRAGKPLVVFFGAKDLAEGRYNFVQPGGELNAHVLFVNNGANHWYQWGIPGFGNNFTETLACLRCWQVALKAPEICLIGTSMGGYAAIQYGAALGARVLAFSTDATLASEFSRSANHYTGAKSGLGAPSCDDLRPVVAQTQANITLIVGERDWGDVYGAHQLAMAGAVRVISLIGVDHWVPSLLTRQSRLGPMLRAFAAGKDLPVQQDAGSAAMHPDYAKLLYAAHLAGYRNDWADAEAKARAALLAYPDGEAAEMILGWALIKLDRHVEAIEPLARAVASQPTDVETLHRLSLALRRAGATQRARQISRQVLVLDPGYHAAHYALGMILMQDGNLKGAHDAVAIALRIMPKNASYRERLADIAKRMTKKRPAKPAESEV